MTSEERRAQYEDRLRRYGVPIQAHFRIELCVSPNGITTYGAQVATLVATSLLGRLFADVHMNIPDVELHARFGAKRRTLADQAHYELIRARPADLRAAGPQIEGIQKIRVQCGKGIGDIAFIGSAWNATLSTMEVEAEWDDNPFGAAMAAILACSEVFLKSILPAHSYRQGTINVWSWIAGFDQGPRWRDGLDLGEVWTIGLGSVGSAAMYFLPIGGLTFDAVLIDKDEVKLENVSRSPLFTATDGEGSESNIGKEKTRVVAEYLESSGIVVKEWRKAWLNEADDLWRDRTPGIPDLLISTANEHHVRWQIESLFPPVQIHASTGMNWQVTAFRHIPLVDACSLCEFPDSGISAPTKCATGNVEEDVAASTVDASLPFLSYAAGLMIAIEAWRLAEGEELSPSERRYLQIRGEPLVDSIPLRRRSNCSCRSRDARVHRSALAGGRFARLSGS